ncbi:MAG TPA: DMT family transporter, partial [Acetobacteraceae bacterium]|nr:DMT family transporter [Acetobacteraceae bacterium]
WSSAFLGAKIGLRYLSPLAFVAVRLTGCAAVLLVLMLLLRRSWAPLRGWRWLHCAIAGVLVNAVGLMAPHVGLTMVGAAQVALVQSLAPLLAAALGVVVLGESLGRLQWLGMALGLAGVALVVGLAAARSVARLDGLALAGLGVGGLVAGTIYFGRFCRAVPLLPGTTVQFAAAALFAILGALLLERPRLDWTDAAIAATLWNTFAVSLGGMALYFVMLRNGTAARTTANFYLVPGTTAILTWPILGERLSPLAIAGFVVAGIGCWMVNRRPAGSGQTGR